MSRIGVFVCHCGTNIAATVDVEAVAEAARVMPNVAFATTNNCRCYQGTQPRQACYCQLQPAYARTDLPKDAGRKNGHQSLHA